MLKKLIKYGNSNALVLDRSILALLDIAEGDVVKLRIEGDKLIIQGEKNITPTNALKAKTESTLEQISSYSDAFSPTIDSMRKSTEEFCRKTEKDPAAMELLKEWAPETKKYKDLVEDIRKVIAKYKDEMKPLTGVAFQKEVETLRSSYKEKMDFEAYRKELLALRMKHAPKLTEMDKEIEAVRKAHGYPKEWGA